MFGEWECWCSPSTNATNATAGVSCPSLAAPPQPAEDALCTVPNLFEPHAFHDTPSAVGPCTEEEFQCYNQSQVLFQGQCVTPLERGPCAEGEWVVLVPGPPLKATCAPRRCPDDHHAWVDASNLKVQPHCQPKEDIRKLLCQQQEELVVNAFGIGKCTTNTSPFELPKVRENGVCRFTSTPSGSGTSPLVDKQIASFDAQTSISSVPSQQPTSPTPSTLPTVLSPEATASFPGTGSPTFPTLSTPVDSPASTSQTVASPGESTPLPGEVTSATSTPFPAGAGPEISTPSPIPAVPENTTHFPVAVSPSPTGTTSSVVDPEMPQLILVDPCVKPPCLIPPSPQSSIMKPPLPPAFPWTDAVSSPIAMNVDTIQVNQDKPIAQLGTSQPAANPVDVPFAQKPLSVIIQTPSTELRAPDVITTDQQVIDGVPDGASKTINESASPAILQNQTNFETVSFAPVPGDLASSKQSEQSSYALGNQAVTEQIVEQPLQVSASNPPEESASHLGNQVVIQQNVDQPQLFPSSNPPEQSVSALGDQVVTQQIAEQQQPVYPAVQNTGIQTFPTIFRVPGAPVVPQENDPLTERVQPIFPETPAIPQLLGQGEDHVHPTLSNAPTAPLPPTNVGTSVHPQLVIIPQLLQQNVNENVAPNAIQIIQNDPSLTSQPQPNGLPFVPIQPNSGNVPLVSIQPEQNNYSSDLVPSTPDQRPNSPVQTERQDGVVQYVLLGQSNVPANAV